MPKQKTEQEQKQPPSVFDEQSAKIPVDKRAEQEILGIMLLDEQLIKSIIQELSAEDFYYTEHRAIFSTIVEIAQTGKPDVVLVASKLIEKGHNEDQVRQYLADLLELCVSTASYMQHVKIVQDKALARRIYFSSRAMLAKLTDNVPLDEVLAELTKAYRFSQDRLRLANVKHIRKYLMEPPSYEVELDLKGKIHKLKMDYEDLSSPSKFMNKVGSIIDHIPVIQADKSEWILFLNEILGRVERVKIHEEEEGHVSDDQMIEGFVQDFLAKFHTTEDQNELLSAPVLYRENGRAFFRLCTLQDYVNRLTSERVSWKQLTLVLRTLDGRSYVKAFGKDRLRVWDIPFKPMPEELPETPLAEPPPEPELPPQTNTQTDLFDEDVPL